jgi:hypothetical protein
VPHKLKAAEPVNAGTDETGSDEIKVRQSARRLIFVTQAPIQVGTPEIEDGNL